MKTLFKMVIVICAVSLAIPFSSFAAQFDAPYNKFEKKHGAEWAKEDKEIDAKLAALEKKFGKKPNIIMVLTDVSAGVRLALMAAARSSEHRPPNSTKWRVRA